MRRREIKQQKKPYARYGVEIRGLSLHTEADNLAQIRAVLDGHGGRVYVFDRESGSLLFEGSVDEVRGALDAQSGEDVCAKGRKPSVP